jgi:UDP-N-acetylmuramate dehydrogenase
MAIDIKTDIPLAPLTTFGIGGGAEYFTVVGNEDELAEAVRFAKEKNLPITILGGGSNVLVADNGVRGLVIKNEIGGIFYEENDVNTIVTAGAGVIWDELVAETVAKDLWGLENLSGIPGTVGATPIQNVGAYGTETADVLVSVRVFDIETETFSELPNGFCAFAYRDSIFKTREGKKYVVTHVAYTLLKKPDRKLAYKDLAARFGDTEPNLEEIRSAVLEIRSAKFPNWREMGTAGSFFKNPIISEESFSLLAEKYPDIPSFPAGQGFVKVPLGWILEHVLKIKGVHDGNVGTYKGQALVIVNYGNATAHEVDVFAKKIESRVNELCNVELEREITDIK